MAGASGARDGRLSISSSFFPVRKSRKFLQAAQSLVGCDVRFSDLCPVDDVRLAFPAFWRGRYIAIVTGHQPVGAK